MKFGIALILSIIISFPGIFAQPTECLSKSELELYTMIMEYRESLGLPLIPLSASLTKVAKAHVVDLTVNRPDQGNCNPHSWSSKGQWTACCYTMNHSQASCMWNKPQEITTYSGNGFEIACTSSDLITPEAALESWKASVHHHNVIINADVWKQEWKAIGVGIYRSYAVVWFGHEDDPAGKAVICD